MSKLSSLNNLVEKMAGEKDDSKKISEAIDKITEYYEEGSGVETEQIVSNSTTKVPVSKAVKDFVLDSISGLTGLELEVVEELPVSDIKTNTIYLVPKNDSENNNIYDEYLYIQENWELIGTTEVDLSNYYNKDEVDAAIENIDIPENLSDLNADSTHRVVTDTEKATWNNKSDFSGDYTDLSNKPSIPTRLRDLDDDSTHRLVTDTDKTNWNNKSSFSGDYEDLSNKPTIPTKTSDLTNDSDFVSSPKGAPMNSSGFYAIGKNNRDSNVFGNVQAFYDIANLSNYNIPLRNAAGRMKNAAPIEDSDTANKKYVDDKVIQVNSMPTASVDNLGKIVQYVGTTDANYTNGYFYKVVSDGQDPATYSWYKH